MSSQPLPVGEDLRRAREEAGLELADVAAHLRIRSNFLSALEESRPDALPGITYAIGYVRTYAAFLGLEPDAAVRRFKEEAAGLNSKTQLVFPSPAPEGRVPGLVLMLVAAVLVGGAYGGWYWVSERDGSLRDLVPAVPERLAQLIEGDAPSLPPPAVDARPAGSYADANPTGVTVARDALPAAPASAGTAPAAPSASNPSASTPSAGAVPTVPAPAADAQATAGRAPKPVETTVATVRPQQTAAPQTAAAPAAASTGGASTAPQVAGRTAAASPPALSSASQVASVPAPVAQAPVSPSAAAQGASAVSPQRAPAPAAAPAAGSQATAVDAPPPAQQPASGPADPDAAANDDTPDVTAPPEPAGAAGTASGGTASGGTAAAEAAAPSATFPAAAGDDVPAAPRIASLIGASEAAMPAGRTAAGPIDRVMIRATGDSWVQVRDAQGTALFTRVLREGDIYRVPEQAGLRLATGNAGALQILVDGNPAPSIGGFGEVVRNVLLDPSRLSAGTAISGNR